MLMFWGSGHTILKLASQKYIMKCALNVSTCRGLTACDTSVRQAAIQALTSFKVFQFIIIHYVEPLVVHGGQAD